MRCFRKSSWDFVCSSLDSDTSEWRVRETVTHAWFSCRRHAMIRGTSIVSFFGSCWSLTFCSLVSAEDFGFFQSGSCRRGPPLFEPRDQQEAPNPETVHTHPTKLAEHIPFLVRRLDWRSWKLKHRADKSTGRPS